MAVIEQSELVELIRQRADIEDDGNHVSNTEVIHFANQALVDLYDLELLSDRGGIYCKNATVLERTGKFKFDLPDDFYKLRGVHYYKDQDYHPYAPVEYVDYPRWAAASERGDIPHELGRYTIRKDQYATTWELHVFPHTIDPCYLAVMYDPKAFQFQTGVAAWDDVSGKSDYVIVHAAISCCEKAKYDTTALQAKLLRYTKEIQEQSSFINAAYPHVKAMAPLGLNKHPVGW